MGDVLTKFDLNFISQKSIKGKSLTNYLAKAPCPHSNTCSTSIEFRDDNILAIQQDDTWELYLDGSKCKTRSDIGIILIPLTKNPIPLSYKLTFLCTNNIAEYEALIAGLRVASSLNIKHLQIYGDSKFIVEKIKGGYQTKNDKLTQYKYLALEVLF